MNISESTPESKFSELLAQRNTEIMRIILFLAALGASFISPAAALVTTTVTDTTSEQITNRLAQACLDVGYAIDEVTKFTLNCSAGVVSTNLFPAKEGRSYKGWSYILKFSIIQTEKDVKIGARAYIDDRELTERRILLELVDFLDEYFPDP
ncbi:hypothetical protein [Hyphococcus sp. DH-69]|uniref:hypothetical protein n=1 Tax=Hyphococcus formosus TaxID=3143534 RepID=UPI00398ACFB1